MFIDDILVYSKSKGEHEQHLRSVFKTLKEPRLYAKFSKCEFWLDRVNFLGHVMSGDELQVDLKKVKVVTLWLRPTLATKIRNFFGLVGSYRHFVENCSRIATPLKRLTQNKVKFEWLDVSERSF